MNSFSSAEAGKALKSLDDARQGERLVISAIVSGDAELDAKLREIGFSEGDEVELLTRGPFAGQTPGRPHQPHHHRAALS